MSQPLKKSINFFALIMIAAGSSIGSGIFISPSDVAGQLSSGAQIIVVWLIGGIVTMTGALSFGELAARHPGTGGVYIYLKEAYGDMVAFLYGWCNLTVITSGAIAALCLAFARYFSIIFHFGSGFNIPIALSALLIVTVINMLGAKLSAIFSSTLTVMKVLGIGIIVIICFSYGSHLLTNLHKVDEGTVKISFGIALVGVLWSYGGWHHASYVGGEVNNAQKVLPKALLFGAIIITLAYISVNAAYLSVMTTREIASSTAVASDALSRVTMIGGLLVAVLIGFSTFGTAGIYTLSAPRIYFKMGEDRTFFPWLSDLHPKFGTPMKAVLLQSSWAAVLMVFWGTFEKLTTYVVFMDWIFMTMAAIGLFIFRRREPETSGTKYKVPFFPIVPMIFIGISTWFLISTIFGRPYQAVAGLILMGIGLPVYFYFKKQNAVLS
ncbi:MAG: amino acid permease [Saprospiraceae bacterium]|uniref:Amino acid permease n=1 Tax=Candidatus Opimibacter skivensis TaxID=2982028 RepID=A0A9D7SSI1_9BACT|nr:amino acid permease [Candidatus Opimibacter skivensis]